MRYHFHIRDRDGLIPDEEGSELPSLEAAREEAHASARDLVIEDLKRGVPVNGRQIEIADPRGTVLQRILVQEVLN